jgi:uncharacterized protein YdaT
MPWTLDRYPPAMQRLPWEVRAKAIEIANAMLAEGYGEGQSIRMAIAAAKKWAGMTDDHARGEWRAVRVRPSRVSSRASARRSNA